MVSTLYPGSTTNTTQKYWQLSPTVDFIDYRGKEVVDLPQTLVLARLAAVVYHRNVSLIVKTGHTRELGVET